MASPEPFNPINLPYNDPSETRKVAIVTGGNSGIGWYTTLHLYIHGWTVYLAARNPTKAADAVTKIKAEANLRKVHFPSNAKFGEIIFTQLDLSTIESTKKGLSEFLKKESQLDLLINNAGVMALPAQLTKDNIDIQIQTNHVSPLYFTINLLPLLEKSKFGARIVFVSSLGHYSSYYSNDIGAQYSIIPTIISGWIRYGNSKLANIHAAKALALKFPSILSVSLHPGVCLNTNLMDYWHNLPYAGPFIRIFSSFVTHFSGVSNEEGSYNSLYTALSPDLTVQNDNGKYFMPVGIETAPSNKASSPIAVKNTWDWTVSKLVDLGFFTPTEVEALHEPLSEKSLSFYNKSSK